jgi:hypothetical protein
MFSKQMFINVLFTFLILFTVWSCAEPTAEEKKATETERLIKVLLDSTTVPSLEGYSYKSYDKDSFSSVTLESYKDVKTVSVTPIGNGLYTISFPYVEKDSVLYYSVVGKLRSCGNTGLSAVRLKEFEFIFEITEPKNWIEFVRVIIDTDDRAPIMTLVVFKDSHSFNISIGEYQNYFFNKK